MTWQDELRQLDEELASGRISAEDYRRRRDEVLAQASGTAPASPQPGQQGQAPFPPPFRWETSAPETTQVMRPISADEPPPGQAAADATQVVQQPATEGTAAADATQVVPNPIATAQPQEATQVVSNAVTTAQPQDAERTQVVRPSQQMPFPSAQQTPQAQQGPQAPQVPQFPPRPPQQQMPTNWPPQQMDAAPPWVGSDLPPLDTGASWVKQGPEVFDGGGKSNTGKIVGAVLAAVLLVGVAFGAYWIWGRGTPGGGGQQMTTAAPTSTVSSKPADPLVIANLPGTTEDHREVKAFTDVPGLNYLTPEETQAYQTSGATKVAIGVSHLGSGNATAVLTVQASGPPAAAAAVTSLVQLQLTNGMVAGTTPPHGVQMTQVEAKDGQPARVRGHYAHKGVIVRVDVSGADLNSVLQDFSSVLAAQLKVTPADG